MLTVGLKSSLSSLSSFLQWAPGPIMPPWRLMLIQPGVTESKSYENRERSEVEPLTRAYFRSSVKGSSQIFELLAKSADAELPSALV